MPTDTRNQYCYGTGKRFLQKRVQICPDCRPRPLGHSPHYE